MILLTQQQRLDVLRGELVPTTLDQQDVLLVRSDIYSRICNVLDMERAVILAGHTRGPVEPPSPLESIAMSAEDSTALADVVVVAAARRAEIEELVLDDREQTAWRRATGAAQSSWRRRTFPEMILPGDIFLADIPPGQQHWIVVVSRRN